MGRAGGAQDTDNTGPNRQIVERGTSFYKGRTHWQQRLICGSFDEFHLSTF
jgi:hypothetical protein